MFPFEFRVEKPTVVVFNKMEQKRFMIGFKNRNYLKVKKFKVYVYLVDSYDNCTFKIQSCRPRSGH